MKRLFIALALAGSSFAAWAQTEHTTAVNNSPGIADFPNYHPLIVHFPLVLLLAAAVLQIAVVLMHHTNKGYNYAVTAATVIGFITALLAATLLHAHPADDINAKAKEIFEAHEQFAFTTLWISGVASLFKVWGLFNHKKWVETVALLLLLSAAVTVSLAGHRGSELVYKQGVGPEGQKLEHEHE